MSLITPTSPNIIIPFHVTKSITTYRIILTPAEEGGYVVTSPDLDALITQGENENDAMKNAYEATELLLEDEYPNKEFNLVIDER
jgi:predicted RNase H-like HicB family nuclease